MSEKYTKGPWRRSGWNIVGADNTIVAKIIPWDESGCREEDNANATLIASAPLTHEELKTALSHVAELKARLTKVEAEKEKDAKRNAIKLEIADALQECAYVSGVKAGWNAAMVKDDAYAQRKYDELMSYPCNRLKVIKAAREALAKLEEK